MPKEPTYSEHNIKVLSFFDSMKKRPGMYLGDHTDGSAVLNLIKDAIQPALQSAKQNQCNYISIVIEADKTIKITDDGPGLPIQPVDGESELSKRLTQYTPAVNSYGDITLDLLTLSAYTSELTFTVHQDGHIWHQSFNHGVPAELTRLGKTDRTGSCIELKIIEQIMPGFTINRDRIAKYLKSLSYLFDQLAINYTDHSILDHSFQNKDGLTACVEDCYSSRHKNSKFHNLTRTRTELKGIIVEAAITFTDGPGKQMNFVNAHRTSSMDSVNHAFISGLAKAIDILTGSVRSPIIWHKLLRDHTYAAIKIIPTEGLKLNSRSLDDTLKSIIANAIAASMEKHFKKDHKAAKSITDFMIHKKVTFDWQKANTSYGVPSSDYVKNHMQKHFKQPERFEHIIEYYRDFERCLEACKDLQNISN